MSHPFVLRALVTLLLVTPALALTLPVSEDTATGLYNPIRDESLLTRTGGGAKSLSVRKGRSAFLRFDVGSLAADVPSGEVGRALAMVYLSKVARGGPIDLHVLSSDWTEMQTTRAEPEPDFVPSPFATIPASMVIQNQFVLVDVTAQAKAWLDSPGEDFGIVLRAGDPSMNVSIASKEGTTTGYPALIQIERTRVVTDDHLADGIDATKLGDGAVDNRELGYLDGATSRLQNQLDGLDGKIDNATTELQSGIEGVSNRVVQLDEETDALSAGLAGKVSKAGDVMNGSLGLPANGLTIGTDQFVAVLGNIGIGTAEPAATLDVRGDVKLGEAGELYAPGGEENLRIIRGIFTVAADGSAQREEGSGFTLRTEPDGFPHGHYNVYVDFDSTFPSPPTLSLFQMESPNGTAVGNPRAVSVSESSALLKGPGLLPAAADIRWHLIVIGPR